MATGTTTVTTEQVFEKIATDTGSAGKALTTLSTSINDCLKTLNAAAASTTVTGTGATNPLVSSSTASLTASSATSFEVNLLLNLAKADSTGITQCRMVNDIVNSLPEARKNELWFNHTLKFTKDASGAITLYPTTSNKIVKDKATFLTTASSSSSPPTTNNAEITIIQNFIDNIIAALATATGTIPTYKTPPVYLQYATATAINPWSQVAAATDHKTTIEITPDVRIGISQNKYYALSFADETKYVKDAPSLTFMDGATNFIPDDETANNMNTALFGAKKSIIVKLLGGGKKKRQSRKSRKYTKKLSKGGKRSRKSRRF